MDSFDEFAAAVGEGADGSDEDAASDDFLSWLLVNADSIDPNLIFDEVDLPLESLPSESDEKPAGGANELPGASDEVSVTTPPPQLSNEFIDQPASRPPPPPPGHQKHVEQQQQQQRQGAQSLLSGGGTVPLSSLAPAPNISATISAGDAPLPTVLPAWVRAGSAAEGGAAGAGGSLDGAVGGGGSGVGAADALLQRQLATAGVIPSDPLLAMQLGARMALSGNLTLIPFGVVGGTGMPGGDAAAAAAAAAAASAAASTAAAAAAAAGVPLPQTVEPSQPPAASSTATLATPTATPLAAAPAQVPLALPAWTGLPLPPGAFALPSVPGNASVKGGRTGGGSSTGEAVGGRGAGQAVAAVMEGEGLGAAATAVGDGVDGVGKKRPRAVPSSAAEVTTGRDTSRDRRRRKRMSRGELEERVKQVTEDNARLKLHLADVNEKQKLMANKKKLMEMDIAAKLEAQRSAPSAENNASLAEALSRFKDLYADYGEQRKKEVEFHLKQLERQILPTDTTKMSLWTLDQDDSFYEDKKRGSLSVILRKELGVSEEQIARIQERRTRIKSLLADLRESLRLVRHLQRSTEAKNAKFERVMAKLQSSFSPHQVARLLLWVSANRAHISKLPLLPKRMAQHHSFVKQEPMTNCCWQ